MPCRHCILLACALALASPVAAHEPNFCQQATPHPIDVAFERAIARSGGITADMRDAQAIAYAAWDKQLNEAYGALVKQLPKPVAARLRASQRAWLAWDRSQTEADWSLLADDGTGAALQVSDMGRERLRARVCELQGWQLLVEPGAD